MSYGCTGTGCAPASFGLAVPTPLPGDFDNVSNMTATGYNYCGSKWGFQQMLQDLGFYHGQIDGQPGTLTHNAAAAFAQQHGAPWGGAIQDGFCAKLIEVWTQQMGGGGGTQETPPPEKVVAIKTFNRLTPIVRPATTDTTSNSRATSQASADAGGGVIDDAQVWWGEASTGTKVAVGVGAVAVVGLAAYALMGGSPSPKAQYTANRKTWYAVEWKPGGNKRARFERFSSKRMALDYALREVARGSKNVTVWVDVPTVVKP